MYSFDAAIRGYHYYRKYWQPEVNQKLYLSDERANAFDVFSIKASNAEGKIVGHLPMKVSRITKFLMDHGARWTATLRTTQYRKSPLIQGGLEIPCSLYVYMMSSTVLRRKLTQRYTKLVEDFYMEPPDNGCVGSFVETPVTSIDFDIPFTSKGKGRRKDSKGKDLQKQKEQKSVVIKDIRSFSGGSTTVKSSSPLNSKEK